MQSSIRDRHSVSMRQSPTADRRLTIGFLPLPSISASPVCTPTTTMNTGEVFHTSTPDNSTPADASDDHTLLRVPPTWTATPPTPPSNNMRRSVMCLVRPTSPLSPSTSFPASIAPVSNVSRRESALCRPRALSDSSIRRAIIAYGDFGTSIICTSPVSDLDGVSLEKAKDDVRRYHALMELLSTEVSYLADLRALFSTYLRNLPSLCRTPSTFSLSSSRNNSLTQLPKTSVLSDQALHPLTTIHPKPKPPARQLFTNREVDLLTRNAEQVLQLHENFVEELRTAILPLGFSMEFHGNSVEDLEQEKRIRNLDAAVGQVSAKFAIEASRFDAYQSFCSGHPQALHLVHRIQQQNPVEWEAYEQHCASLIASDPPDSVSESTRSRTLSEDEPISFQTPSSRKRTTSLTSIDGVVRKVGARTNSKEGTPDRFRDRQPRRLSFLDYMIKPIQRICKYPLLLDQLRPGAKLRQMSHPSVDAHVNVVVESAAQAMRHVASAVDEARHRQDVKIQSSLIISRIALVHPSAATSHMASVTLNPQLLSIAPPSQILTPSFLSSLGTCLLAGSLDVMYHEASKPSSSAANINAKYLGAFLYRGGYLILVKVAKGKVYEPRHWFSLAEFDVVDLEEEDTSLPCTFSLIWNGHQFDLTAACQREKDAWLSSIHESRLHPPTWINEPTSSIQLDGQGELVPSMLDEPFEMINALPTIQSLPELAKDDGYSDMQESVLAAFGKDVAEDPVTKPEMPTSKLENVTGRRSSTTSVRAMFTTSSEADTILIRRSSPAARFQVDQGLQDVISESVLAARSQAIARDELFQAPKVLRGSGPVSRSGSALSLTGLTKNRLSKHESVRVPRKKSVPDDGWVRRTATSSRGPQKRRPRKLSIVSSSEADSIFQPLSDFSPSPFSQCSPSTSTQTSPTATSPPVLEEEERIFRRTSAPPGIPDVRSASPAISQRSSSSIENYKTLTQGILKRLTKGSRHQRVRSAPYDENVPETADSTGGPLSRAQSPVLPDLEFGPTLSFPSPQLQPTNAAPPSPEAPRRMRLLSAGAPISFRHSSPDNTGRTLHKKTSIFKRLKGLDLGLTP